jgi:hypothetical protein
MKMQRPDLSKVMSLLRVRALPSGLEVSDQVLRLAYRSGKEWTGVSVVLAPGIMERGEVKDRAALAAALRALRAKVPSLKRKGKKMNVVVSLDSTSVYTQSFVLPKLSGDELKKAIDLNIQMSSPDDLDKSYCGTRVLAEDDAANRIEVSAAFVPRRIVDMLAETLFDEGFIAIRVESRAISLVRIVRSTIISPQDTVRPFIIVDLDNEGIDFLVMRNGEMYFEYPMPWRGVADEKGQIPLAQFDQSLSMGLRQMFNFYRQHWQESVAGILVIAPAFTDETVRVVREAAGGTPVIPITISSPPTEWLVALGAGMHDGGHDNGKGEIDLSGEAAADRYHAEQVIDLLGFWAIITPSALALFVVALALAANFLGGMAAQAAALPSGNPAIATKVLALEASSTAFNGTVALVGAAQADADTNHLILDTLDSLAASSSVMISRITLQDAHSPVFLSGTASTENDIVQFKNLVQENVNFGSVNLPLSGIQPAGSAYSFSMTFPLAPNAFTQAR